MVAGGFALLAFALNVVRGLLAGWTSGDVIRVVLEVVSGLGLLLLWRVQRVRVQRRDDA